MRPLRLEIEGFTVYKKPQVIDFEKLSFFIIQGRTGAGKTSIVDAITYALYGKVPRYGDGKATRHVISKGSPSMRVSLDFSVGGRRFRIERFYSPRLREDQARAYEEGRRLNLTKPQIERWVQEVTGLDYRTFTKVILLPQGEFDRFLKPKQPKERRDILINLLNLEIFERMRQIASEIYRSKEGELGVLREELSRIGPVLEEDIERLQKRRRDLDERVRDIDREISRIQEKIRVLEDLERVEEDLRRAGSELDALSEEMKRVEESVTKAEEELKEAEREAGRIPELKRELEDLVRELERVEGILKTLERIREKEERKRRVEEELSQKEVLLRDREERLRKGKELIERVERELEDLDFDEERFAEVLRDLERKKDLERKLKRLQSVREEIRSLEGRSESLRKSLEEVKELLTLKEEELKRKELHLYAHQIRESLKENDLCPVCGGVFGRGEPPPLDTEVGGLAEEVEALKREKDSLEKEIAYVQGNLRSLREEERRITSELKPLEELRERNLEEEFKLLKKKKEKKTQLEKLLESYRRRYESLRSERETTLREVERLRAEREALKMDLEAQRETVREILAGEDPKKRKEDLLRRKRAVEETIQTLEGRREELKNRTEELRRRLSYLESRKDSLERTLSELEAKRRELTGGLEGDETLEELREDLRSKREELSGVLQELGEINKTLEQMKENLSRRRELQERIKKLEEEIRVYKVLAEDLRSDRLQNFAASLMLLKIVDRSSHYLFNFTGAYEFTLDGKGNLLVVDRVQGVEREVSSLSGGETFLASLSLALGVSDVLSSQANLESLFIDEGFGSLDDETRERVSEILEAVRISINRMVGIISHIPDLAERFHQRIVVERHGDFSTVKVFY
jgi:exonuclease SbcC